VNADHIAGELAAAVKAVKLIMMTDVPGIYRDLSDKSSLIQELSVSEARKMIESKQIDKGMIPKVEACITALAACVERAHIIDGTAPHSLLVEIFTDTGIGTMIVP
jgi:acetylglutamate kinase